MKGAKAGGTSLRAWIGSKRTEPCATCWHFSTCLSLVMLHGSLQTLFLLFTTVIPIGSPKLYIM